MTEYVIPAYLKIFGKLSIPGLQLGFILKNPLDASIQLFDSVLHAAHVQALSFARNLETAV